MKAELKHITRSYSSGQTTLVALDDVSLLIPSGQFAVVVGANGSGKSTLLNILASSVKPQEGSVWLDDRDVTGNSEFKTGRMVARVFQDPLAGTAPALTLLENFRLASLRTHRKGLRSGLTKNFRAWVKEQLVPLQLGLENKLDQPAGQLSGGQRQALTLVMASLDRGGMLLLDEPAAALDPRTARVVMDLAADLIQRQSLTAILVTHNMKDALHYGERLLCLEEGKVVRDLPTEEKVKLEPSDLARWFDR